MGNNPLLSLIPFNQPVLSSNWVWLELVQRDFAYKNEALCIQQMKSWAVELTVKRSAEAAAGVIAAATAASPSAAAATSTAALEPAPSALSADTDAGRERSWKNFYSKL